MRPVLIRDLRIGRAERLGEFCERYGPPARAYIGGVLGKKGIHDVDIEELVQGFFADKIVTLALLRKFDPARASGGFRPYFKKALKNYLWDSLGGRIGEGPLLDDNLVPAGPEGSPSGPDVEFHIEWVRTVLDAALKLTQQRCEESGAKLSFELFASYHVRDADPSWEVLAQNFGERVGQILGADGQRGEVRVELLADFVSEVSPSPNLVVVTRDGTRRRLRLESCRDDGGRTIVKFSGVDTAREAQNLTDCEIQLPIGSGKNARNLAQKAARCMREALRDILIEETGSDQLAMAEMRELLRPL